jgi:hypothetical protein
MQKFGYLDDLDGFLVELFFTKLHKTHSKRGNSRRKLEKFESKQMTSDPGVAFAPRVSFKLRRISQFCRKRIQLQ